MAQQKKAEGVSEQHLEFYAKCRRDPWFFLSECVFTLDQVDQKNPIKKFPTHFEYLKLFVAVTQKRKLIAVPKSRRMTMSWCCIALILWDVMFHKGRLWAFVSKKEEDSADLVSRAKFIYDNIPKDLIPTVLLPKLEGGKMTKSPPVMNFYEINSKIQGFPMGADQLRQFTFSGIFGDECAFWEVAQKFYASAKPTLDGGGQMILVSSRAPGFFKKIVFDQIDNPTYNFPEVAPATIKKPMEGVDLWQNPKNGFTILDIHYTANPSKRGKDWREATKAAMPIREFLMEYEKNWDTFEGLPVFPDFRKDLHIPLHKNEPHLGLPLLVGLDFGLTPACVVAQLQGQSLKVLREYTATNKGIKQFLEEVMPKLRTEFPEWEPRDRKDYMWCIDPAGHQRAQTDARSCVQQMNEMGIRNVIPGAVDFESRRAAVEQFLIHVDRDGAGLEINQNECPVLIEGMQGGYRYTEGAGDIEPSKLRPIKDRYSHANDAFQYLCTVVRQRKMISTSINLEPPAYDLGGTSTKETRHAKVKGLGRIL